MITATVKIEELPNGCIIFEFTPTSEEAATIGEARIGIMVGKAMDIILETIIKDADTLRSTLVKGAKDDSVYEDAREQVRRFKHPE